MTLNEIIYSLREVSRELSDDSRYTDDLIVDWINNQRAYIVRKELEKYGSVIDENVTQPLGCVPVSIADTGECCSGSSDCSVLRTEIIPLPVKMINTVLITHVGTTDKLKPPFSFVDYDRAIWCGNGAFNKNIIFAFYYNNKVYIKTHPDNLYGQGLQKISVRGVFQDPRKAFDFAHCNGDDCWTYDSEYPINNDTVELLKDNILKGRFLLNIKEDKANDADTTNIK